MPPCECDAAHRRAQPFATCCSPLRYLYDGDKGQLWAPPQELLTDVDDTGNSDDDVARLAAHGDDELERRYVHRPPIPLARAR